MVATGAKKRFSQIKIISDAMKLFREKHSHLERIF